MSDNDPKISNIIALREYLRAFPLAAKQYQDGDAELIEKLQIEAENWNNHKQQYGPTPDTPYPMYHVGNVANSVVFLKNFITKPNIIVGDYTYYHHMNGGENFENENVSYHYEFMPDKLIIGKFCQIASQTKFVMNASHHQIDGISSYPFTVFGDGFANYTANFPQKGDTIIGNDVWFGYDSCIMPGIKIGDGAIIATKSLVTKDVPPYTIVGGNPARIIRQRFDDASVAELIELAWWDWPIDKITRNLMVITSGKLEELRSCE